MNLIHRELNTRLVECVTEELVVGYPFTLMLALNNQVWTNVGTPLTGRRRPLHDLLHESNRAPFIEQHVRSWLAQHA